MNVTATLTVAGPNTWTTDSWEGNDFATGPYLAPGSEPVVTVEPNEPDSIAFVQQPTLTQFNTNISPAVTVKVEDAFGNPTPGKPVTMTINPASTRRPDGTYGRGRHQHRRIGHRDVRRPQDRQARPSATSWTRPCRRRTRRRARERRQSVAFDIANQVSTCTGNVPARDRQHAEPERGHGRRVRSGRRRRSARRLGPAIGAQSLSAGSG